MFIIGCVGFLNAWEEKSSLSKTSTDKTRQCRLKSFTCEESSKKKNWYFAARASCFIGYLFAISTNNSIKPKAPKMGRVTTVKEAKHYDVGVWIVLTTWCTQFLNYCSFYWIGNCHLNMLSLIWYVLSWLWIIMSTKMHWIPSLMLSYWILHNKYHGSMVLNNNQIGIYLEVFTVGSFKVWRSEVQFVTA